jgi:uncharacterized membrane protein
MSLYNAVQDWMETTWVHHVVLDYAWSWPTLETLHFLGLCTLIGSLLVMDLRLIGFQNLIPLRAVHALMPVAIISFGINLISGLGFVIAVPRMYTGNWSFWAKMICVALAGLNFLIYYTMIEPKLLKAGPTAPTPFSAKAIGVSSLVLWFSVLSFGRLLPYLGVGGG